MVVRDGAVVNGQRPRGAGGVLHVDTAAVGGRNVVGDGHIGQGQAHVALVADAAAAGEGPVARLGEAVLDREPSQDDGKPRGGGDVVGVDVEDAVEVVAIDDDRAAAGVPDREGAPVVLFSVAGVSSGWAGGDGDLIGAGAGQVDGVTAGGGVGRLDGRAHGDGVGAVDHSRGGIDAGRDAEVGQAVDVEDGRDTAILQAFQVGAAGTVPARPSSRSKRRT